ncbi:MAG: Hpt domain-containing protein [Deltaproteobacteria bacterium]|nr:Hpt domain-containing protein [Deltaproteobacteria bacterium]
MANPRVEVDKELEPLVAEFLERRRQDMPLLKAALAKGDFETLRTKGHQVKGAGGGYGFDHLSQIGRAIEEAAKVKNGPAIQTQLDDMESYLAGVEVIYQ